jgi:hypothetical protein
MIRTTTKRLILITTLLLVTATTTWGQSPTLPEWVRTARVAGLSIQSTATADQITMEITRRKNENVSVLELDTSLSHYLSDAAFQVELNFIQAVTQAAHQEGLKVVIYYPAMEVITPNGEQSASSMFKDHPDWVQVGIGGVANVFYGGQEDWVEPGAESAWMSPNSPYRQYFINRVRKLAQETDVDGIWVDVPIYLDTGAPWADVGPFAAQAFRDWSVAQGYHADAGFEPPTQANFSDPVFRIWLRWRHENLAAFIEDVRVQALDANPNFVVGIETYPMDYMDTVWTGLDPAFMHSSGNFFRIWEVDSVSNTFGMKWSSIEDFSNKIAMYKWGRALDRDKPSWAFAYGNEALDAGLVLGATVATGTSPFETKTPVMTQTVNATMRTNWYGFIRDNEEALLKAERLARVGVWFSSPTREYQDMPAGAQYGMYLEGTAPIPDPDWWAVVPNASLRQAPHLGGWRGAAHALHQLAMPYKVISSPGIPATDMQDVSVVWLPSVGAMSDAEAAALKQFVQQGGTVVATGLAPATLDELGNARPQSALDDLFGFAGSLAPGARMQEYGQGAAIYRPDLQGLDLFVGEGGNSGLAERTLGEVEQILRIHTPDDLIVNLPKGVFVDISKPTATEQHLYIVNYTGAQQPLVSAPVSIPFEYRAPQGFKVVSAMVKTPDVAGQSGNLPVLETAIGVYAANVLVDQFALVTYQLAALPAPSPTHYAGLSFSTTERQEAVQAGLNFILNAMRDTNAAIPYRYGVRTNLLDNDTSTDIYTGGHHVTAEHMGLLLRVTALLKDETAYQGAYEFVRDVLYSKGYHVMGWSMHKQKLERFLQADVLNDLPVQFAANAPLDDLRVIHGLLDGGALVGRPAAEALGRAALQGLYWTSVTDRKRGIAPKFPAYPGGLLGYSWDWADQDDATLTPSGVASGLGRLGTFPIPVDYQDLETISMAAQHDPRWKIVLASAVDLLLAAEIAGTPGLFYNGLSENGDFTGDFEFQEPGQHQGQNLKVIQELWIALHLKRVSNVAPYLLDGARRTAAAATAQRSYHFFKTFYQANNNRIPEYLSMSGTDVPNCSSTPSGNCLVHGTENLFNGEVRIYAQLARLALLFDDDAFAAQVIENKILADRISNPADPRYGMFGVSTTGSNDAEAWNTLESLLTLSLEAAKQNSGSSLPNHPPTAFADSLQAGQNRPLSFTHVDLLANDVDPDDDILALQSVDTTSVQGGTIVLSGTRYIYTPVVDFLGEDTFTYTITDGFGGQSTATVAISVIEGGGGSSGIFIDGDLAEWPPNASMGTDPDDISGAANKLDLLELLMTHDATHLYVAYRNDGPVVLNWGYTLYLDTDLQAATGFGFWDIGTDYVIQGPSVFQYAGNGTDWVWTYIGDVTLAQMGNVLEFSFPRAWIGNPPAMDLIFYGDNAAYTGGNGIDFFPSNVDGTGTSPTFISYLLNTTGSNSAALTVAVAGDGAGTVTSTPPGINCGVDCQESVQRGAEIGLTAVPDVRSDFVGWSGACAGLDPVCSVTMTESISVTASFALKPFPLSVNKAGRGTGTVTSNPGGIDCGMACSQIFSVDTEVTLTAQAAADSMFVGWSGACTGVAGCRVTLTQAQSVTATFNNTPPVAEAGADQTIDEETVVTLSGSGSSARGDALTYAWTQMAGPAATLSDAASPQPTFIAPRVDSKGAVLIFGLTVTDTLGSTATDQVHITVLDTNIPPIANAGPDQTVIENTLVTLDGSGSFDMDGPLGRVSRFAWVQTGGPSVTLSDPEAAQPTFISPLVGLSAGFQPGDTLPGFILTRQPAGSIADVSATATYAAGQWSVMLTRALRTSDANQDVQFDLTDAVHLYPFSIAYLDNTGADGPRHAAAAVMSTQDTRPYRLGNEASDADLRARRETPADCDAFTGESMVTRPADPSVIPPLTLRAAYDDAQLYLCVTAPDPNGVADTMKSQWTFTGPDGADWQRQPATVNVMGGMAGHDDEDRIAIWWDINAQDFATEGCQALCHDQRMQSKNSDGQADLWHWQAARTNPAGFAADEGLAPSLDCDQPCRQSDAAVRAISTDNERQIDNLTLPSFISDQEPGAALQSLFRDAVPPTCPPDVCSLSLPTALLDEVLEFALTVSDAEGLKDTDHVTIRVVEAGEGDTDADGVQNTIEDQAPNGGDGNQDGIADRRQGHVASLPNAMDGRYVTLVAPEGTLLVRVEATSHPSPGDAPQDFVFPLGFLAFEVQGLTPGGAVSVTLWLPEGITPETYYQFGPTPDNSTPHWYAFEFDGSTGAELQSDRVILHFVDGQHGDHDLTADGTVVDLGAVALRLSPFTLRVVKAGTGQGTVTSGPTGISCGNTCRYDFVVGTTVTLTAEPAVGSAFAGWQGACRGTAPCTVTMVEALEVTASFDGLASTPSVPSNAGGGGGGGGCALAPGTRVDPTRLLVFGGMVVYLAWRRRKRLMETHKSGSTS